MRVELVRRLYEAWDRRDMAFLREQLAADFEMDLSDRVLNPAVYHGADGIERLFAEIDEIWEEVSFEPQELIEAGDEVAALVRARLTGRSSGISMDPRLAQVWTFSGAKPVAMRTTPDYERVMADFQARARG